MAGTVSHEVGRRKPHGAVRKQEVIPAGSGQTLHSTPYMNGTATTRGVSKCMRFFVIHNVITSNDVTVCLHTMLLAYVDSLS